MSKITITRTKNTVSTTYLPYTAYKEAIALATEYKGEIGKTDKGNFKATFNSVETAKNFVTVWTANYNANRKVEVAPAPKSTSAQKPKASKPTATKGKTTAPKKTSSSSKTPRKSKGNAFDYSVIKGNSKSEKNKALHAVLVGMGIGDSRKPEYQAVWNARPWAK